MTDHQFHWYMAVNWLVAVGTLGAVFVALFGRFLFRPKLQLELESTKGEWTSWRKEGKEMLARYYHVRATNPRRRWSSATGISLSCAG